MYVSKNFKIILICIWIFKKLLLLLLFFWLYNIVLVCIWILKSDYRFFYSVQFSSFTQLCLTFCDPMDCSTPGFPVHYQLPELAKTHVYWVGDAIQSSHPLLSPSPPVFNLSQHQGLFQWVSSSHQVAKVLGLQLQHQSFQLIFRTDFLKDFLVWSFCSSRDSQESSPTPQFTSISSSALSILYGPTHIHTWLLEKP